MKVNTLWIGSRLSDLEILTLTSHLNVGHEVTLWTYEMDIQNVPVGVLVKDAREIMEGRYVFAYEVGEGKGSYSACSNLFRYKLLLEQGGWWIDADVVALRRFEFEEEYVFASERLKKGSFCATPCAMKVSPGSALMQQCWEISSAVDRTTLEWGTIGPKLLTNAIFDHDLEGFVVDPDVFCPVDWFDSEVDPFIHNEPDLKNSFAVHLWQDMWRRKGIDKNSSSPNSLYERLKNVILPPC